MRVPPPPPLRVVSSAPPTERSSSEISDTERIRGLERLVYEMEIRARERDLESAASTMAPASAIVSRGQLRGLVAAVLTTATLGVVAVGHSFATRSAPAPEDRSGTAYALLREDLVNLASDARKMERGAKKRDAESKDAIRALVERLEVLERRARIKPAEVEIEEAEGSLEPRLPRSPEVLPGGSGTGPP